MNKVLVSMVVLGALAATAGCEGSPRPGDRRAHGRRARTIDDGLARLRILAGSGALPAAADEAARLAAVLRRLS